MKRTLIAAIAAMTLATPANAIHEYIGENRTVTVMDECGRYSHITAWIASNRQDGRSKEFALSSLKEENFLDEDVIKMIDIIYDAPIQLNELDKAVSIITFIKASDSVCREMKG